MERQPPTTPQTEYTSHYDAVALNCDLISIKAIIVNGDMAQTSLDFGHLSDKLNRESDEYSISLHAGTCLDKYPGRSPLF